jgi:hypothetical protein
MRAVPVLLFTALFLGCVSEEPMVPLLQLRSSSEDGIREPFAAIQGAGLEVKLARATDFGPDQTPAWVDREPDAWVVLGRADDRPRVEQALEAYFADMRTRAAPPPPQPLVLGTRRSVVAEEVAEIQGELARRRVIDQAVRKNPRRRGEMSGVDADNTAYLRRIVADVGWIDVARFGKAAASAAFLLVQHSGDLPLMLAALPEIAKDLRGGALDGQSYALLYDRTRLMSGVMQRYGSQISQNEAGELVVRRLEDPENVDARRKELGLMPLRQYLALFGREVKIER